MSVLIRHLSSKFHQTSHLDFGFIRLPTEQLNCFAKSHELESVPITLKIKRRKKISGHVKSREENPTTRQTHFPFIKKQIKIKK